MNEFVKLLGTEELPNGKRRSFIYVDLTKFNPYHDERGRFSTADGSSAAADGAVWNAESSTFTREQLQSIKDRMGTSIKEANEQLRVLEQERIADSWQEGAKQALYRRQMKVIARRVLAYGAIQNVVENHMDLLRNKYAPANEHLFLYNSDDPDQVTAALYVEVPQSGWGDGSEASFRWLGSVEPGEGAVLMRRALAAAKASGARTAVLYPMESIDSLPAYYERFGFVMSSAGMERDLTKRALVIDLAKYDPNQPRDERGRFATADGRSGVADGERHEGDAAQAFTLWHGTAAKAVASIKAKGIKPKGGPGADTWAVKNGYPDPEEWIRRQAAGNEEEGEALIEERRASVFLSTSWNNAARFATAVAEMSNSEPVIVEARIPLDAWRVSARADELSGGQNAFRFKGTIRPEWITEVFPLDQRPDMSNLIAAEVGKADYQTVFVILFVDGEEEVAKFNPYHDERGRFSTADGSGAGDGGYFPLPGRRGHANKDKAAAEGMIAALDNEMPLNPLNPRQNVFFDPEVENGLALIELHATAEGFVHLSWIEAKPQGQGIGSRALARVLALADEHGVPVEGSLWEAGGRESDLARFYEGFGFTVDNGDVVRQPGAQFGKDKEYDPNQPRDRLGRWSKTPGTKQGPGLIEDKADLEQMLQLLALLMDFNPALIEVREGPPDPALVGPPIEGAVAFAAFEGATGKIIFFSDSFLAYPEVNIAGVMAHEIAHFKWTAVLTAARPEHQEVLNAFMERNYTQLAADDGVTRYSTIMWERVAQINPQTAPYGHQIAVHNAIHETLAEMARLQQEGQTNVGSPIWREFEATVNRLYQELDIAKFNPNHDERGRFATADGRSAAGDGGVTSSAAFKAWFGNSKVVDANGNPLVVYRGEAQGGDFTDFAEGSNWFTPSREDASYYAASGTEPRAFYLKSEKLLDLTDPYAQENREFLTDFASDYDDWNDPQSGEPMTIFEFLDAGALYNLDVDFRHPERNRWNRLMDAANRSGYDGVVANDFSSGQHPTYVVFDPRNIKSADRNDGGFDPTSTNAFKFNPYHDERGRFATADGRSAAGDGSTLGNFKGGTPAEVIAHAKAVASSLGYDPDLVSLATERTKFQYGGIEGDAAAEANLDDGTILIHPEFFAPPEPWKPDPAYPAELQLPPTTRENAMSGVRRVNNELGAVVAHEIEHQKFEAVLQGIREGRADPAFAKLGALLEDRQRLASRGGVSPYSDAYWNEFRALARGQMTVGGDPNRREQMRQFVTQAYYQAIHETLAEAARKEYLYRDTDPVRNELRINHNTVWGPIYSQVNALYPSVARVRKFNPYHDERGRFTTGDGQGALDLDLTDDQTQTKAFKTWFGDSKVVDENGDPLVVYHGTKGDFSAFEIGRPGVNSNIMGSWEAKRAAIFFTPDPDVASEYAYQADERTGAVMPVYLKIENPIDLQGGFDDVVLGKLRGILGDSHAHYLYNLGGRAVWEAFDEEQEGSKLVSALRQLGYDGAALVGSGTYDRLSWQRGYHDWAVFSPTQIKSASGNRGSFDPSDPDVTKFNPYHDERGRFTYGPGGKAGNDDPVILTTFTPDQQKLLDTLKEITAKRGYDPDKIFLGEKPMRPEILGEQHNAMAAANTNDGTIVVFPTEVTPENLEGDTLDAIMAHEIEHQKWQRVLNDYTNDLRNGNKYGATYKALDPILRDPGALAESDGLTTYSEMWWVEAQDNDFEPAFFRSAVHETLAEIARREVELGRRVTAADWMPRPWNPNQNPQPWIDLYYAAEERYAALKGVEKFNPYHDERGRFATADGRSAAADGFFAGPKEAHARLLKASREYAVQFGFDPQRVELLAAGERPTQVVATYDHINGIVRVNPDHFVSDRTMGSLGPTLVHEITHAKWENTRRLIEAGDTLGQPEAVAEIKRWLDDPAQMALVGSELTNRPLRDLRYANYFWQEYEKAPGSYAAYVAVHETLAELARTDYETQLSGGINSSGEFSDLDPRDLPGGPVPVPFSLMRQLIDSQYPVTKFNPYHDERGRFTTADRAGNPELALGDREQTPPYQVTARATQPNIDPGLVSKVELYANTTFDSFRNAVRSEVTLRQRGEEDVPSELAPTTMGAFFEVEHGTRDGLIERGTIAIYQNGLRTTLETKGTYEERAQPFDERVNGVLSWVVPHEMAHKLDHTLRLGLVRDESLSGSHTIPEDVRGSATPGFSIKLRDDTYGMSQQARDDSHYFHTSPEAFAQLTALMVQPAAVNTLNGWTRERWFTEFPRTAQEVRRQLNAVGINTLIDGYEFPTPVDPLEVYRQQLREQGLL